MQLSLSVKYAIKVLCFMSNDKSTKYSSKTLSQELQIPYKYLTRIMTSLVKSGFIKSQRGRAGGISIAKDLNDIKRLKMTFDGKMAIVLINLGVFGMTVALTIAGYGQVLQEGAQLGATWEAYFVAQNATWFTQAMGWRLVMGVVTFLGFVFLVKDLLTIGKNPENEK